MKQGSMDKAFLLVPFVMAFSLKDKMLLLYGAGDTAAEEASYLSKLANKVYMIVRRDEMRASKIMQQRVFNAKNIEILWNTRN